MIHLRGKITSIGYDDEDTDLEFATVKFVIKRDSENFGTIVDAFRDSLVVDANIELEKETLGK